jgi:hypothetical protein
MAELKLPKLPERTPVKLTITLPADLKSALDDYAEVYEQSYGEKEPLAELIPAMLAAFLRSDRTFIRRRK